MFGGKSEEWVGGLGYGGFVGGGFGDGMGEVGYGSDGEEVGEGGG